jgi:hypothetical protein
MKYTKIFSARPSKIYPNWDFWFENKPSGNSALAGGEVTFLLEEANASAAFDGTTFENWKWGNFSTVCFVSKNHVSTWKGGKEGPVMYYVERFF